MTKEVNPADVLRAFVNRFPTQRKAAKALNISEPYLSDMLKGNRQVSENILNHLGLRRAVVQEKAS